MGLHVSAFPLNAGDYQEIIPVIRGYLRGVKIKHWEKSRMLDGHSDFPNRYFFMIFFTYIVGSATGKKKKIYS